MMNRINVPGMNAMFAGVNRPGKDAPLIPVRRKFFKKQTKGGKQPVADVDTALVKRRHAYDQLSDEFLSKDHVPLAHLENSKEFVEGKMKKPKKDLRSGMYIRRSIIGDVNLEQEVAHIRKRNAERER